MRKPILITMLLLSLFFTDMHAQGYLHFAKTRTSARVIDVLSPSRYIKLEATWGWIFGGGRTFQLSEKDYVNAELNLIRYGRNMSYYESYPYSLDGEEEGFAQLGLNGSYSRVIHQRKNRSLLVNAGISLEFSDPKRYEENFLTMLSIAVEGDSTYRFQVIDVTPHLFYVFNTFGLSHKWTFKNTRALGIDAFYRIGWMNLRKGDVYITRNGVDYESDFTFKGSCLGLGVTYYFKQKKKKD